MLAAKVVFPVLFLVSLVSEARYHSRLSRVFRSSAWDRLTEEQDWYFEQCRFVNAWKEHLGHVSVLAFLDPAWQYSFRQAVMLELLSSRLRKSDFPDIQFFVISPSSDLKNDKSENDLEIEAWREIGAKYEMENFVNSDFLKNNGTEIIFLQDDPQSRIWERFRASREHAVIIDRCGKLTYHVIVPWSILFFPYVKAAILSTYMDDPCGGCNPAVYQASNHENHVVELTKSTKKDLSTKKDSSYREIDTKFEIIWTTESLPENLTHLHHESSSEEERETSTASSILLENITNDFDRANFSMKSTTYQYDSDATESRFDEDHLNAKIIPGQEDSTNSGSDATVSTGTVAIFEPQSDVLPPEQKESHPTNNNSLTANHDDTTADSTLLLDEPATEVTESDSTFADQEMMTSNFANEIRDNTTPDAEHFGKDAFLPLRIIMYAPHLHKNGKKMKKYTHMILKVGDPDFHKHPDSGTDVVSLPDVNAHITSFEEYDWQTTEADEENINQTYTFNENESPGLYGEVADYWKSYEDNDIADQNETFNDTYNSTTNYNEEHRSDVNDYATSLLKSEESYLITNVTENPNVESSIDLQNIDDSSTIESSRPINENEQIDKKEEIRYKLIEHYNKLLSWIDYRLNK